MSYTVYATKDIPYENESDQITYREWVDLADSDPEFEVSDVLSNEGKTVYLWKPHPDRPAFHFSKSLGVGVRLRDVAIFRKLFEIAEKLGAVVEGENTERYRMTEGGVEQFFQDPADGPPAIVYPIETEPGGPSGKK